MRNWMKRNETKRNENKTAVQIEFLTSRKKSDQMQKKNNRTKKTKKKEKLIKRYISKEFSFIFFCFCNFSTTLWHRRNAYCNIALDGPIFSSTAHWCSTSATAVSTRTTFLALPFMMLQMLSYILLCLPLLLFSFRVIA